jgi:hypothetical protein
MSSRLINIEEGMKEIDFHCSWPFQDGLSFLNFGMPGITGWITFRGSKQANLPPLDRLS